MYFRGQCHGRWLQNTCLFPERQHVTMHMLWWHKEEACTYCGNIEHARKNKDSGSTLDLRITKVQKDPNQSISLIASVAHTAPHQCPHSPFLATFSSGTPVDNSPQTGHLGAQKRPPLLHHGPTERWANEQKGEEGGRLTGFYCCPYHIFTGPSRNCFVFHFLLHWRRFSLGKH